MFNDKLDDILIKKTFPQGSNSKILAANQRNSYLLSRKDMKLKFIAIISVILCSMAALFFLTGEKKAAIVLADADAVATNLVSFQEKEIRVRGFVKPGSVLRYGDKADFIITLSGKEVPVHFDGSTQLPDTFSDGAPVRADGTLDASNRLVSNKVEAKCASKYETDYAKGQRPHPESVRQL